MKYRIINCSVTHSSHIFFCLTALILKVELEVSVSKQTSKLLNLLKLSLSKKKKTLNFSRYA